MRDLGRLWALVLLLNLVRYLLGRPIESVTVMRPMHSVMPRYPQGLRQRLHDPGFYRVALPQRHALVVVELVFHLLRPRLRGPLWRRSLEGYGLMALFFCSLAAVYMNHFTATVRPFFLWSMVDALILFPLVGLANGLRDPWFFRTAAE